MKCLPWNLYPAHGLTTVFCMFLLWCHLDVLSVSPELSGQGGKGGGGGGAGGAGGAGAVLFLEGLSTTF